MRSAKRCPPPPSSPPTWALTFGSHNAQPGYQCTVNFGENDASEILIAALIALCAASKYRRWDIPRSSITNSWQSKWAMEEDTNHLKSSSYGVNQVQYRKTFSNMLYLLAQNFIIFLFLLLSLGRMLENHYNFVASALPLFYFTW
jgi:hypothetical protein